MAKLRQKKHLSKWSILFGFFPPQLPLYFDASTKLLPFSFYGFMFPWMVVFEEGLHTRTSAQKKHWSKSDLKRVVTKTQEKSPARIPFVMRHPKNNLPVLGYTSPANIRLNERDGKTVIEAQPTEFAEGMLPALAETDLKYFSVSINDDFSLYHIGVTDNPAVKGIPGIDQYQFSADDDEGRMEISAAADFSDSRMAIVYSLFRSLRDWAISKWGLDEANKAVPDINMNILAEDRPDVPTYIIDTLNGIIQNQNQSTLHGTFEDSEMKEIEEMRQRLQESDTKLERMRSEFSAEIEAERKKSQEREAQLQTTNQELSARLDAMTKQHQRQEFSVFVDTLIRDGKVIPAEREYHIDDLMLKANVGNYQFSDGEKSAVEKAMEVLKNRQPLMQFSDMTSRAGKQSPIAMDVETLDGRNALHAKVKEFQRNNPTMSFEDAYNHVFEEIEK